MAVQFIIGRAGAGKTHHCVSQIQDALRADPIDGPRLILLVPEQASQQMERALLTPLAGGAGGPPPGAHRAEVLSFNRLAFRVLDRVGAPVRQALTEPARTMVLRHLVGQLSDRLSYYAKAVRWSGFYDRLAQSITELIQEAIEPEALRAAILDASPKGVGAGDEAEVIRGMKLADLATIYGAYLEYLGNDRVDPSQHLQLARERMAECTWLRDAHVWVDGFASFSRQELLALATLAKMCERMQITVLLDPELRETARPAPAFGRSRLFGRTLRTFRELSQTLAESGVEIETPMIFEGRAPRFSRSAPLALLERKWFVHSESNEDGHGANGAIEVVELPSRRTEAEYAAARVLDWVTRADGGLRARDIAVIVRDLELYHDVLREAFTAKGIPHFMDQRRCIDHHPLVEFIRMLVTIAVDDLALESMRILLKTGIVGIPSDAIDELENYIVAHGISGLENWTRDDWSFVRSDPFVKPKTAPPDRLIPSLERINKSRREVVAALTGWFSVMCEVRARSGESWAGLLLDALDQVGAPQRLGDWTQQSLERGNALEAEENRQIWRDVTSFLDDFAFAFCEIDLSAAELREIIETGLSQLTLGLIPPTVDQTLVSSIERSRHPDVKAVIVLGLNDGIFPARKGEDSIFNDDDRTALRDRGLRVGPPTRDRLEDEAMLFYIAATRPSERLVLTYAQVDDEDRALAPSPFVEATRSALPGLQVTRVPDSTRSRSMWDIHRMNDVRRRMTLEFSERRMRRVDEDSARGRWNELYSALRLRLGEDPLARLAFQNLADPDPSRIDSELVQRLFGGTLRTSVSQLETYAACPFQFFSKYVLRLQERREARIEPVDVGQVHHAILEEFVDQLVRAGEGFGELSDERLMGGLTEACAEVAGRMPVGGALSDARERYRLRRSAEMLGRILRSQRECWGGGKFRPRGVEVAFGIEERGGLPALTIDTPKGRRVQLRGVIDRVDLAELSDEILGVVVDYKRTRDKRLDMSHVYHGLSLQLLAYLLALSEHGTTLAGRPIRPIGAFYLSSAPEYKRVNGPVDESAGPKANHPPQTREASTHPSPFQGEGGGEGRTPEHAESLPLTLTSPQRGEGSAHRRPTESPSDSPRRLRGILSAADFVELAGGEPSETTARNFIFQRKKDGGISDLDRSDGAEPDDFREGLAHVRRRLGELADGILDGFVSVSPVRLGNFSPCSWCPMADVCRFEMGNSDVRFLEKWKRSQVFRQLRGDRGEFPGRVGGRSGENPPPK